MKNLFFAYLRLYPGKADLILNAIKNGIDKSDSLHLTGKDRLDEINSHILDALD